MQTANVMVHLGGDHGNQVPKRVTAAEIAVLIAIHGNDAITDIEPVGEVPTSNRDELARLHSVYGGARDGEGRSFVSILFPGAGARVFDKIEELGLSETLFKPTARANAPADPLDHDGDGKKGGTKARKAKAVAEPIEPTEPVVPEQTGNEPEDEVKDMPDGGESLFK